MKGKVTPKFVRLYQDCFDGIVNGLCHICSVTTLEAVRKLTSNLDRNIQEKLASWILQQRRGDEVIPGVSSQAVLLPNARGGKPVPVQVGPSTAPPQPKLTHHELLTMASSAPLTGKKITTIAGQGLSADRLWCSCGPAQQNVCWLFHWRQEVVLGQGW